jgi:hypothetical protein
MNVRRAPAVEAAVRTLSDDERRRVFAWFTHLGNWENDEHTRQISKPTIDKDVYVLNTSDDLRIFFSLDAANQLITILDIAKPSRFERSHQAAG